MKRPVKNRIISALLVVVMVAAMIPLQTTAAEPSTATLVTDASTLKAGDQVIIASAVNGKALGTEQRSNNRAAVDVAVTNGVATLTADIQVLTLQAGTQEGTFAFYTGEGYLYAASSSKNYLRTEETLSDNASWTIEINADTGAATVKAQGTNIRNWLRYNKSSTLFAAYSSGQQDIEIYKVDGAQEEDPWASVDEKLSVYEKVEAPAAGDTVLLYNAASGKVLSSTASGYALAGVDVTVTDNYIAVDADAIEWKVDGDGSTYSFAQGEMMLGGYVSGGYTNISTDASKGNTGWELTVCNEANNAYYVRNATLTNSYDNVYLEWYNGFKLYGATDSTLNEDNFGFVFYKLVREGKEEIPGETTPPETTAPSGQAYATRMTQLPQNGNTIIFYNSGNAMGSTASDNKLAGVAAEVIDDKLPIAEGMAQLKVTVNEQNQYIFTLDGKYLTSAPGGNGLSFADTLTDCGKWTAEAAVEDTWYFTNVGANHNGNYNQALEYYSGFTTFGNKKSKIFQMQIFQVDAAAEPGYSTIKTALDGKKDDQFTVKGVVTMVDGRNIHIQDATGGINLYMDTAPADIALGDTIIGTGIRGEYRGLQQLKNVTYEKSSGLTLTPKVVNKLADLTNTDVCTYIKIAGLQITVIDGDEITVQDADGTSIVIYKPVTGDTVYAVGDKITFTGAVSIFNDLQLRNTLPTEITPYVEPENHIITDLSELTDGARVVIFNPENMKALSQNYSGYYNAGVDVAVADGKLTGYGSTEIWTVNIVNGKYTFSTADGKKLSMDTSFSSTPLDKVHNIWNISSADTPDCFYIENDGRDAYLEWYADEGNWSSYYNITEANEGLFAQQFYLVVEEEEPPVSGGELEEGSQMVIYNLSALGVLGKENDDQSISSILTTIEDGKAIPANGAYVFTVQRSGEYYRFYNETVGYLCSNGTGNNAFYSLEASEDADWMVSSGKKGGYNLMSRTAKFQGKYDQYLEYYAGSYKTYSMHNVTDYDIYEFFFYPLTSMENVQSGIVNIPAVVFGSVQNAYIGKDYQLTFTVEAPFGVAAVEAKLGQTLLNITESEGTYTVTVPAALVTGEKLTIAVSGTDAKGVAFTATQDVTVVDEPTIGAVTPASGSETGSDKRPVISAQIINAGEGATVTMSVNGNAVNAVYADGRITYTPEADLAEGRTSVTVIVTRADGKTAEKTWRFTLGKAQYQLYFGQLHSHTTYSDGSGSLTDALAYIRNLPDSANVDFVAFTDHSNYFDSSDAANPEDALYDLTKATAQSQKLWNEYVNAIKDFNASQGDIIAIPGFEMTWSGGPGHINTFNTPGIVSRNNAILNNKTNDAGMKAYYALLSRPEGDGTISQFNHPGSTFGTFSDFAYWDALIDSRIQLVEVGNGEGQIGAGGYYPSYEYYTMALDKGWHVAPTNNQDNHKGKWGNANDARDVILTDDFSLEGIYQAIRDMRVYSTEDKNLEIYYTVNGNQLGSIIEEVPEKLNISVIVSDPDTSDSISKVEIIVNSGKVAYTWSDPAVLATGELAVTLDPQYSYYYIKVTQGDGDLAVTAPVWVGENLKLGISSVESGTSTPVTGEELTLTTTVFNSEKSDATVKSVTYAYKGGAVIGVDTNGYTVPVSGTKAMDFKFTPDKARVITITATVVMDLEGTEYVLTKDITLDVGDASKLVYIGIDASHYNEYVAGNYKDSMGNFGKLASEYSVRTVELKASEDLIAACKNENGKYKALILTAPSRRNGSSLRDPYATYSDAEIAAIVAFNKAGGIVILAGWSDYYEHYADFPAEDHMAAQQNKILAALGSSLRISDDGTNDNKLNGGQTQRLYFNTYGNSFLVDNVEVDPQHPNNRLYTEVFSHYGGASIYTVDGTLPATVTPVVFGHSTTYSKDSDSDGLGGNTPKYPVAEDDNRLMIMATEQLSGQGLIVVSGAAFMSNFEVQATIEDSGSEKNYSNYKICENLLQAINPVQITPIADVQAEKDEGVKFVIEGVVTSNASGYDKNTAFFDCIYVQDETAGINAFPVAGNYKIGDKVRITGTTSSYQGERQINVSSVELISEGNKVEPKKVTAAQINDGSVLGSLVTLKGTVVSFEKVNGLVQTIMVRDAQGNVARVFIDGYICTDKDVENLEVGCNITVTGCASYDNTFNAPEGPFSRIRVRNRLDVVCSEPGDPSNPETGDSTNAAVLAGMMLLSLAALTGTVLLSRRKERV